MLGVLLRGELPSRGRHVVPRGEVVVDLFVGLFFQPLYDWPRVLTLLQNLAILGPDGGSAAIGLRVVQQLHLVQGGVVYPAVFEQLLSIQSLAGRVVEAGKQEAFAFLAQSFGKGRMDARDYVANYFLEVDC